MARIDLVIANARIIYNVYLVCEPLGRDSLIINCQRGSNKFAWTVLKSDWDPIIRRDCLIVDKWRKKTDGMIHTVESLNLNNLEFRTETLVWLHSVNKVMLCQEDHAECVLRELRHGRN